MSSNYNGRCRRSRNRIKDKVKGAGKSFSSVSRNSDSRSPRRRPVTSRLGGRTIVGEPLSNISPDRTVRTSSRHRSNISPCRSILSGRRQRNNVSPCRSVLSGRRQRNNVSPCRSVLSGRRRRSNVSPDISTCSHSSSPHRRYVSPYRRPRSNMSPDRSSRSYSRQRSNVSLDMSTSSLSWDSSVESEPFSSDLEGSLSPWQTRQNELNSERRNDKYHSNTRREIGFVNVRDNYVNRCTYREGVSEANNPWHQWQCSLCKLDFTDRQVKIG